MGANRLGSVLSISVILSLLHSAAAYAGTPIDVYILSGQSNMVGSGLVQGAIDQGDGALLHQDDVLYHFSITLDPANQTPVGAPEVLAETWGPLRELTDEGHSFGLELAFGRVIADHSQNKVAIIKSAINGAAIRTYTPSFGYWRFLGPYAQSAIEELESMGYDPTVKAFVWVQGSSDANSEDNHALYGQRLEELTDSVRGLWGSSLHVAQLQQHCCGPFALSQIDSIREAKSGFTSNDANATLTEMDHLLMRTDRIHYHWRSLLELGEQLATETLSHSPEDINSDGEIDTADLGMMIAQFGFVGRCRADINGDRMVDAVDLGSLLASFGK